MTSFTWKFFLLASITLLAPIFIYADSWTSSNPSHSTLYADTITSKTDASSVNIADSQGLFVTGDITTLGNVGIGTTAPQAKLHVVGTIKKTDGLGTGWYSEGMIQGDIGCGIMRGTAGWYRAVVAVNGQTCTNRCDATKRGDGWGGNCFGYTETYTTPYTSGGMNGDISTMERLMSTDCTRSSFTDQPASRGQYCCCY